MSEPWAAQTPDQRYDQLVQQTGAALIAAAPPGWRRIDLIARIVEGMQDFELTVIMSDLSTAEVDPPAQVAQALVELRRLMHRPETGTWLSVRYVLNAPDEFRVFYNHAHDPLWDPPIPPAMLRRDLATYPRPAEKVPAWLRRTVEQAEAGTGAEGAHRPGPRGVRSPGGPSSIGPPSAGPSSIGPAPLGPEAQRDLTRRIADLLAMRAPADRDQVRALYRAAGGHEELRTHVIGLDGRLREWDPPPELAEHYRELRAGMHKDGVGTWTGVSTVVEWPLRTSMNYLFTEDPRWQRPPLRQAVLDELEAFPRAPEHVPDWMKAVLPDAERVAEVAGRFRRARVFDHRDAGGRPVVDRPPVPAAEREGLLHYLNTAPALVVGRGFDPDVFDPSSAPDVPAATHTDGTWIWTAAVPHYLAKHGVPPEPELVVHIRANGFAVPPMDHETTEAAYTALTGEVRTPATSPPAAPAPAPVPGAATAPATPAAAAEPAEPGRRGQPAAELSPRERRTLSIIEQRVSEAGALPQAYRILGSAEGATCLERVGDEWQVADYERGRPRNPQRFAHLWDAGAHLLGALTIVPSALRAGGGDRNTAAALDDWPIQPLPGEPPLTLLAGKHIVVLMPGREIVRYGPPTGNLAFAAGTEFNATSLRAERERQGPHRYRVARELRVLSGQTVPWHDQPGGGTAYLLPRAVDRHIANGSLTDPAAASRLA
jgi:hypothetical protein